MVTILAFSKEYALHNSPLSKPSTESLYMTALLHSLQALHQGSCESSNSNAQNEKNWFLMQTSLSLLKYHRQASLLQIKVEQVEDEGKELK